MTENIELAPKEGETPDQFLARIEDKKRELKVEETTPTPEPELVQVPAPTIEEDNVPSQPDDKPAESAPAPSAAEAPLTEESDGDKASKAEQYAKKKGWKTPEDVIQSYRELERKLGERKPEPPPVAPIAPAYGYPPYQPIPQPNTRIHEIARQYGFVPEDVERMAPFVSDMAKVIAAHEVGEVRKELDRFKRDASREREIERLKQDPAFSNPDVIQEMGRIMESDPRIVGNENALTIAFNQALGNVGRRALEGTLRTAANPAPAPSLPTKPPVTARGAGPAATGKNGVGIGTKLTPANFNALPLAEKERALRASGHWRSEEQ